MEEAAKNSLVYMTALWTNNEHLYAIMEESQQCVLVDFGNAGIGLFQRVQKDKLIDITFYANQLKDCDGNAFELIRVISKRGVNAFPSLFRWALTAAKDIQGDPIPERRKSSRKIEQEIFEKRLETIGNMRRTIGILWVFVGMLGVLSLLLLWKSCY